ncbi:c-type cytochrome [Ramlibacter sp.]|uniref:c-type cytochrome n=1 Tax=Ramlibacter sp. TaxID=1917967 RepID=UPI002D717B70|nr:c-type cytochrome [Ramlibacter sp.]HYD78123.1 c-type cytochrome [Ramlibacter sp.]
MKHLALALVLSAAAALAACGKQESAPASQPAPAPATSSAPAATPAAAPAAAPAANAELGKSVYNKTCALCHAANVAGAPKPGDKADWGPRIAQGNEVLYKHAIEGYTGSKGQMPAKGGNSGLSDDEVKAGVDYMVGQSR